MPFNSIYQHFFSEGDTWGGNGEFDLSRKARSMRLREIRSILRKHHVMRGFTPVEFRSMLEDLGPSFVKIGQTLSTRSEILPKPYREELEKLQSESHPLPFEDIREMLMQIYGDDLESVFSQIDPNPLGSASLAQVHRATLATGETVAVKVQRPGVRATMAQDIAIIRILARRASHVARIEQMLDLTDVVEEIWNTFLEETDFAREAENLMTFRHLNADFDFIDCPRVFPELCSEHCLVMEYIEGIPIHDRQALLDAGYDLAEIGEKMLDNYATQVLDHGFFHADPHPGNVIIRDGKIVYIDLGIMGRLNAAERAGLSTIIEAVGLKDPGKLKDALLSFAITKDNATIDHSRLLADLDLMLASYASCDVADLDVGQMLSDIISVTRASHVTLPSSIANVSRGIVTIEGTIADFIPNDNIVSIINDHIAHSADPLENAQDMLFDIAVSLRKAAEGSAQAAAYSGETLKMITRGQVKMNMEVLGSDAPLATISKIVNRLTIGIIIAGLFIGSSMFAQVGGGPRIFGAPFISFFGFLGAFVLSVWVIFDIWRRK